MGPSALNQILHVAWTNFPSQKSSWDDPQYVTPVDGMFDNSCATRETNLVTVVYQDPDTLTEQTVVLGISQKWTVPTTVYNCMVLRRTR